MTATLERELIVQEECTSLRHHELQELLSAAERAADLSVSVEDLLRLLAAVQAQVHACRKAVVCEARATGHSDREVARMLKIHVNDFVSRFPAA
ncbi:hypothetical protein ICL81_07995 [Leucobacter sp. cx-328]|uniref:hypothetical protein n=1 Tax=unclassified Leucobacter TaxID=2621730 RepID=UPI00165E3730|nr:MULTISPECIES: hypothetical protein [unclassified Leucobacter]MBC9944449.1 hypothetical protein [Leucobacter sp. cx-328]